MIGLRFSTSSASRWSIAPRSPGESLAHDVDANALAAARTAPSTSSACMAQTSASTSPDPGSTVVKVSPVDDRIDWPPTTPSRGLVERKSVTSGKRLGFSVVAMAILLFDLEQRVVNHPIARQRLCQSFRRPCGWNDIRQIAKIHRPPAPASTQRSPSDPVVLACAWRLAWIGVLPIGRGRRCIAK